MSQKNRVILIHGLHQAPFIMRPLAKRLQAQGLIPINTAIVVCAIALL